MALRSLLQQPDQINFIDILNSLLQMCLSDTSGLFAGDEIISFLYSCRYFLSTNNDACRPEILYVHAINESVAFTNRLDPHINLSHYEQVDFSLYTDISYLKISVVAADPCVVERIASDFPMLDPCYTEEDLYRFADRNAVSGMRSLPQLNIMVSAQISLLGRYE